jgi:hypothetical protein
MSLYAIDRTWPMAEHEREIFHQGLRAASIEEPKKLILSDLRSFRLSASPAGRSVRGHDSPFPPTEKQVRNAALMRPVRG